MKTSARFPALYWKMVRYRVAIMLWMFLLLGAARHDGLAKFHPSYLLAALALSATYVAATTVNDISDKHIDAVNHPNSPGRPLAAGLTTERDLRFLSAGSAVAATGLGSAMGVRETLIILMSLMLAYAYSLKPVLLSHRTFATPLVLAGAYVVVPYMLGATIAGGGIDRREWGLIAALVALFIGRIILKDFRDRAGDEMFGKQTILLRFGKDATCAASGAAVIAGNALLLLALSPAPALAALLELFVVAILAMFYRLWKSDGHDDEQFAIGVAAKMGNGLLLTVLGLLLLRYRHAPLADELILAGMFVSLYGVALAVLLSNPRGAVIGYRG